MKRLALLVVPAFVWGCHAQVEATVPQPPTVSVGVEANAPAPPAADATVDVQADAPQEGEPEEVQATSEPPDPVYEEQTDSPDPSYVWIGGYWGWNGTDWGWNWGRWAAPPAGQVYIEPYYERVGGNVVYVHGYWGGRDAPRRSYGGDTIRFTVAARPANYHRGEHIVVEHRAGPAPGKRPGGAYAHATGTVRPVPHETTPHRTVAATATAHESATPRGKEPSAAPHETAGHETAGHEAAGHGTPAGHETAAHEGSTPHENTAVHENPTAHEGASGHATATQPHDEQKNAPGAHAAPTKAAPAKSSPAPKKK